MSLMQNADRVLRLHTRNRDNVVRITESSFWTNDIKQEDNKNRVEIRFEAQPNWLKAIQEHGNICYMFPVDGPFGVFEKDGLPISVPIPYEWQTENGVELKNAGDCDCLIINEKWHFLEFKTDSFSQTLLQILNNRNKAEAQLAKSLVSFRERLSDADFKCICVVVTPHFYSYPQFNASTLSRKIAFLKKYKCELMEVRTGGNESYDLSK
ncbi:MAG: hypothetical protein R3C61_20745 [Bacteroidia bacterium]